MKTSLDFSTSQAKRRIYLDLDIMVAEKAKQKAAKMRLATKRYIEILIERDCAKKSAK